MKQGPSRGKRTTYCGKTRHAKVRYKTLKDAKRARTGRLEDAGNAPYLRIYKCPECKGYHLTSQPIRDDNYNSTVWMDDFDPRKKDD